MRGRRVRIWGRVTGRGSRGIQRTVECIQSLIQRSPRASLAQQTDKGGIGRRVATRVRVVMLTITLLSGRHNLRHTGLHHHVHLRTLSAFHFRLGPILIIPLRHERLDAVARINAPTPLFLARSRIPLSVRLRLSCSSSRDSRKHARRRRCRRCWMALSSGARANAGTAGHGTGGKRLVTQWQSRSSVPA